MKKTLLGLFALAFVLWAVPARSQECSQVVSDGAGIFKNAASIEEAAQSIDGAEVHVYSIQSFRPYGNMDQFQNSMKQKCSEWIVGGDLKNNVIVLAISMNPKSMGIYAGSQYRVLESHWQRIQADIMRPKFRDGDFDGGMIAALREIKEVTDAALHPARTAPAASPPQVVQINTAPSKPMDLSWLKTVFLWLIGLVLLGGIVALVIAWSKNRAICRASQIKAKNAKQACANAIAELADKVPTLKLSVDDLADKVSGQDVAQVQKLFQELDSLFNAASIDYGNRSTSATDPDRNGLSVDEYEAMESNFSATLEKLNKASEKAVQLQKAVEQVQALMVQAGQQAAQAKDVSDSTAKEVARVRGEGFLIVDSEPATAKIANLIVSANNKIAKGLLSQSLELLSQAVSSASELLQAVRKNEKDCLALPDNIVATEKRLREIGSHIEAGRAAFESISKSFAKSSWESVAGNGTEAQKRFIGAMQALDKAWQFSGDKKWPEAMKALEAANKMLDDAESFINSILSRKEHLERAKKDAPAELEAAIKDLVQAAEYFEANRVDIKPEHEKELTGARKETARLRDMLAADMPDYPAILKLVSAIHQVADKILGDERTEHEDAERLRQLAVSSVRDAERAISKAEEYVQDHQGDVGQAAKNHLTSANGLLLRVKDTADLSDKVELAKKVYSEADDAYNKAKNDFSEAESEREHEREQERERQRESERVAYASSHSSSSYGGSSSWGGSSFSVGGSSSWGGGGGSVGGSSGW